MALWAKVVNDEVVSCLDYNPGTPGEDWREVVDVSPSLSSNQILDGAYFEINKDGIVSTVYNIKTLTKEEMQENLKQQERVKQFELAYKSLYDGFFINDGVVDTGQIASYASSYVTKKNEINALPTLQDVEDYIENQII